MSTAQTVGPKEYALLLDAVFVGERGRRDRFLLADRGGTRITEGNGDGTLDLERWQSHVLGQSRVGVLHLDVAFHSDADFDGKVGDKPDPARFAEAQRRARAMAAFCRDWLFLSVLVELTRSTVGYRVTILYDLAEPPSVVEARMLLRCILKALSLPDGGAEGRGDPGVFPRLPGAEGIGGTVFAPLGGVCGGAKGSVFVDPETLQPLADQYSVLANAPRYTREDVHHALDAVLSYLEQKGIPAPEEEPVTHYAAKAETPAGAVDTEPFRREAAKYALQLGELRTGNNRNHQAFVFSAFLGNRVAALQGTCETATAVLLQAMGEAGNGYTLDYSEKSARATIARGLRRGMTTPVPYPEPAKEEPAATAAPSAAELPPAVNVSLIVPAKPEHTVEGFLRKIGVMMVWGPSGVAKTHLMQRMLHELAARTPRPTLFNAPDLTIRSRIERVLWIGLEESPGTFRWRLDRVRAGLPEGMGSELQLDHVFAPDGSRHVTIFDLEHYLKDKAYQLVIVDGMTGMLPRLKGTSWDLDNYSVNDVCRYLRALATKYGLAVQMVYHSNKEGTAHRGPSEWKNSVDVMVELQTDGRDGARVIVGKVRDGKKPGPFLLAQTWEENGGPYRIAYGGEVTEATLPAKARTADAFLRGKGMATQAEIMEGAGIVSKHTMLKYVGLCTAAGLWQDTGNKGPGQSPIFAHTGKGA